MNQAEIYVCTIGSDPRKVHHIVALSRKILTQAAEEMRGPISKRNVRIEAPQDYYPPDPVNERCDTMMRTMIWYDEITVTNVPSDAS